VINILQDDILVGTLTVKENMMFSATLRLPASYSWEAQNGKVDYVINELGLEKVANSKVRSCRNFLSYVLYEIYFYCT